MDVEQATVLIETLLDQNDSSKNLADIQELVFRQCWANKGYQEIANSSGYDHDYIRRTGANLWKALSQALNRKVTKGNIHTVLRQHHQQQTKLNTSQAVVERSQLEISDSVQDWGDAIDVASFVGRESEISQCGQWILGDRCRLVTVLGMGGVGKTAIASKVAREIAGEFKYVAWRSLRNAPSFWEVITGLILLVSAQKEVNLPDSIDGAISCLLKYLSSSRCLIIFDNVESILRSGETGGKYQKGYEAYGQLLRRLADESHQSCLIVTSREQPVGIGFRENILVRSLQLSGLNLDAAQQILTSIGIANAQRLIEQYQGNPLALKIAASTIKSIFAHNVEQFLNAGTIVFGDIWDLLEQQFNRLAKLEQAVMYWLAINREEIGLTQLQQDLVPRISSHQLLEILESLRKRSLIEVKTGGFTQQPVVMEYVTAKMITVFEAEINTGKINLLQTHSIIKAQTKDYLQEAQVHLILQPIIDRLLAQALTQLQIERQFKSILQQLKNSRSPAGYAAGNIINLLKYLEIDLADWDFSQLPIWQADLRDLKLQGVNFTHADFAQSVFTEKMGSIFAVDFSPNGKLLATGDNRRIQIWQMPECKHLAILPGHDAPPIWSLAFHPHNQILASGSSDRTVRLWNVTRGECLKILQGHQGSVWSLAFSPNGEILASGSEDGSIKLWQVATGKEIATLQLENSTLVSALAFSPDGNILAAGDLGQGVTIWQTSTHKCLQTIAINACNDIPLAFDAEGKLLAIGFPEGTIKLWNTVEQKWQGNLQGHLAQSEDLCFSTDGKILISSSVDRTIRLWQIDEQKCIRVLPGHQARIPAISLANDNCTLASGSEDGSVKIWNIKTGKCLKSLSGYSDRIWSIAFSIDGQTLASGNESGAVRLWNLQTGNYQELEHLGRVKSVAFSPDGNTLASVNYNYQIKLWNLSDRQCIQTIERESSWCWSIAFSPDSKTIVTCGSEGLVRCWDVATGELKFTLAGHQNATFEAVFLQDNFTLATTSADNTVKLWNLKTGKDWQTLQHNSWVWSVAYNLADNILATGNEAGKIELWHLNTGKCFATLVGHTQAVTTVNFCAGGSLIASAGNDSTLKLWDIASRKCLKTFNAHQDTIMSIDSSFLGNKNIVASSSHDETIKLWDIETGECLQTFQAPNMYEGMNIKDAKGLTNAQKDVLKALGSIER